MTETITSMGLTWGQVLLGVALSVATFVLSLLVVTVVLVKLPAHYFHESHERNFMTDRHRALRLFGVVVKNLFGVFLVVLGVVMSLPGVPGQGILTVLLGIMLLDFPGKRALEYKIVSRPKVFGTINRLRARFNKPPLVLH